MATPDEIRLQIQHEAERLERHAATTTDACTVAKLIAVSDERVKGLLVDKVADGNIFRSARCFAQGTVLFAFDCPPSALCLVSPSFLVKVSLFTRAVVEIIDPFDSEDVSQPTEALSVESSGRAAGASGLRTAPQETSVRTITVTITNVVDRSIDIDGTPIPFAPGANSVQARVLPGTHSLDWRVQSEPGTPFTLTLSGASVAISFSGTVGSAQREGGRFSFNVS